MEKGRDLSRQIDGAAESELNLLAILMERLPSQAFSFSPKIDGAAGVGSGCLCLGFGARTCIATRGMAQKICFVGRRVMFWCANDFHFGRGLGLLVSELFSLQASSGFASATTE